MKKTTLICDGTSDLCLLDIIRWITDTHFSEELFQISAARELIPPRGNLQNRLRRAEINHSPDTIVCHRDSEMANSAQRLTEISREITAARLAVPVVRAVPVRMIESWLLFDSNAIRCAASNRNGQDDLQLPSVNDLERQADPKQILFTALRRASNLKGRRLQKFNVHAARHRIPEFIYDFSPLRELSSFQMFERELIDSLSGEVE